MAQEILLIETEAAHVRLARDEGASLEVVNGEGRVRVPLSAEQAERLAAAAPGAEGPREIERKWLVARLPQNLETAPRQRLRQGYLLITPQASLRIREKGGGCKLTIKRGKGLDRLEVELDVSEPQADLLWPLAGDRVIDKTRYALPDGDGAPLELDVYHGAIAGLVTVEKELDSLEAAASYTPPSWVGAEATDDGRYSNAQLAMEGLPEGAPLLRAD